jgi:PAS domain-containing protein
MLNHHNEHLITLITLITILGAAVSLVIVYRHHQHIDLAAVAPALLRSSMNALTEGVLLLDNRERIIMANSTFAQIVGCAPGALNGIPISRLGWKFSNSHGQARSGMAASKPTDRCVSRAPPGTARFTS